MNTKLELICWVLGFITGGCLCILVNAYHEHKLKMKGQKLIDQLAARKQVDFWFTESVRLFILAQEANSLGNFDMLTKLSDQHELAARQFQEAKLNYEQLEQQ